MCAKPLGPAHLPRLASKHQSEEPLHRTTASSFCCKARCELFPVLGCVIKWHWWVLLQHCYGSRQADLQALLLVLMRQSAGFPQSGFSTRPTMQIPCPCAKCSTHVPGTAFRTNFLPPNLGPTASWRTCAWATQIHNSKCFFQKSVGLCPQAFKG